MALALRLAQRAFILSRRGTAAAGKQLDRSAAAAVGAYLRSSMRTAAAGGGRGVADQAHPPPPAPAAGAVVLPEAEPEVQQAGKVHVYPDEPRVGVGVVVLRQLPPDRQPEVLLIRRAKEPAKGTLCCGIWGMQRMPVQYLLQLIACE